MRIPTRPRRWAAGLALAWLATGCGGGLYTRQDPGGLTPVCAECPAGGPELDARIVLIGDTGELIEDSPNLSLLTRLAGAHPDRTTVVFLGDNVYPRGLPAVGEPSPDERATAERILDLQLDAAAAAGAPAVFLPGNHDWDKAGVRGLERIVAQGEFIAARSAADARAVLLPQAGCPGPIAMDLGRTVRLVLIDTVWLLRTDHPRRTDACDWGSATAPQPFDETTAEAVYAALDSLVAGAGSRRVLLAMHHPLRTRGPHGGHFNARELIFPATIVKPWLYIPLPFIYPPLRYWVVRSDEDLVGRGNRAMVARLERSLELAPTGPSVTAAGHEHSLQVFEDPDREVFHLVSGSGAKTEPVGRRPDTLFSHSAVGVMVLDYYAGGSVWLGVHEPLDGTRARRVFGGWLAR